MSAQDKILKALQSGRKLTGLDIYVITGTLKGVTRICDLRKAGWPIEAKIIRLPSGKRVNEYFMKKGAKRK